MGKKKRTNKERQGEAPEASRGLRNTMKLGIKEVQATVWRMRYMMFIWVAWMTLFLELDSLRPSLLMAPASLWFIYLYADFVREWAWHTLILMWPQCILNLMLHEERSVAQYAQKYGLMEKHKKHRGGIVIVCSKYGICVWRGFIEVIIGAHYRNKSWAGTFCLNDLRMSGHRCRIKSEATHAGTNANLMLDLSRLAILLIGEFSSNGVPIPIVKLLYEDMTMASTLSPIPTESQFLDFLKHHPALKSPRQLTTFTSELFQAYASLGIIDKQKFNTIVSTVPVNDWVGRTQKINDKLLMKVLTYKKYDPNNTISSYGNTSNELFRYLRNFQQHGGNADVTTGTQYVFDMKDLEFIATYEHCKFICRLIHHLLVKTDMKIYLLGYAWNNYTEH